MKSRLTFVLMLTAASLFSFLSCEKESLSPTNGIRQSIPTEDGNNSIDATDPTLEDNGNGKKKKKRNNPPEDPPEEEIVYVATYELVQMDEADPLFRYSISESGDLVLLETNPDIGLWGSDFYGSWSDPFPYANNEVNYQTGLTDVTYQFDPISNTQIDVTRILVTSPYTGGPPNTTITHVGIFELTD